MVVEALHLPLLVSLTTAAAACAAATAASATAAVAAATAMACLFGSMTPSTYPEEEERDGSEASPYDPPLLLLSEVVAMAGLVEWWHFSLTDLTKLHLRFSFDGFESA